VNAHQLSPVEFEQFCNFIYEQCGIRIGDRKVALLSNRIRKRVRAHGFADFRSYYRYLVSTEGVAELKCFLDSVTTNETSFFRTDSHFQWLTECFVPGLHSRFRKGNTAPLRVWSAACACGAEPYSLAIFFDQNRFRLPRGLNVEIVATDISENELALAREGVFKTRMLESMNSQQRSRYFVSVGNDAWQVHPRIRISVEFRQHNLMQPFDHEAFDIILLCNVLIYFDLESKKQVLSNVVRALSEDGFLLVGPSEGVFNLLDGLEKVSTLVYRRLPHDESDVGVGR
jgi:chemotaxis protein methyltransferase CheR